MENLRINNLKKLLKDTQKKGVSNNYFVLERRVFTLCSKSHYKKAVTALKLAIKCKRISNLEECLKVRRQVLSGDRNPQILTRYNELGSKIDLISLFYKSLAVGGDC